MDGWIKLHRKSLENPILYRPNYWTIWTYLLMKANHKDKAFILNNEKHLIKRGQLLTSKRKISDLFSIPIGSVHKILEYLKREHMIEQKSTSKYTVIEIKNYDEYQEDEHPREHKSMFKKTQIDTNKNDKNERILKNNGEIASPLVGKKKTMESLQEILTNENRSGIHTAWQEKAFRYADHLGIKLTTPELKGRWLQFFKKHASPKIDSTVSYLVDYQPFVQLLEPEQKLKYFFATFYKRT